MSKEERGCENTGDRGTEVEGAGSGGCATGFGRVTELDLSEVGVASSAATLVGFCPCAA